MPSSSDVVFVMTRFRFEFVPMLCWAWCSHEPMAYVLFCTVHTQYAWDLVVLSQDWHPANHMSFYENNKDTRCVCMLYMRLFVHCVLS